MCRIWDYQEIIALSEDPEVSFEDIRGQPFTAEEYSELAEFADSIFYDSSLDVQISHVIGMPIHVSVRRLSRMSDDQRKELLSHVPSDLADEITSLMPVGVT